MSSHQDLCEDALVKKLGKKAPAFFAMDYRGVGESTPNTCGANTFLDIYGSDYFYTSYQTMFGEPYIGRRTHDVLAVLDWMQAYGYDDVHLVGRGWGSLPALFAAVLDKRVKQITLKNAPIAFAEWATTENMQWPESSCLQGVLHKLDLPDCYKALKPKKLQLVQPWSAEMKQVTKAKAKSLLAQYGIAETALA